MSIWWRSGAVEARWSRSTKLTYVGFG